MNSPGFAGSSMRVPVTPARRRMDRGQDRVATVLGSRLVEALRLAARAPSMHNTQPWVVLVHDPHRWTLNLAPDRRLRELDHADRGALISLGAFIENLCIAAGALGYEVETEDCGTIPDAPDLVKLRIVPARAIDAQLATVIPARCTLRRPFQRRPVDTVDLDALCRGIDGLSWTPAGTPRARQLAEIVAGAAGAVVMRPAAQAELAAWLRPGPGSPAESDGLGPVELALPGLSGWLAGRLLAHGAVSPGVFRRAQAMQAARLARNCGGWLLLTTPDSSLPALLDAGRRLERLLLRARGLGLGVQPMCQPLQEPGWRQDLERAAAVAAFPRVLLRVGYSSQWPSASSARRPPEAFTHLLN